LAVAAFVCCLSGQAQAYGLFSCVDAAGREVCVIDTGEATNFSASQWCNQACPACQGRCDAARYYPPQSGHWQKGWQVAPGITGDNIMTPGAGPQEDARRILNDGLVAPAAPETLPPSGYTGS
jgi:hypothetical protein